MPLTHGTICKVQKIITLRQTDLRPDQRGYYRDLSHITPHIQDPDTGKLRRVCPPWTLVQGLMDNWLLDYEELGPWEAHKRFEYIHPFVDGNGRTGRMLMWWQELKAGKVPTMIKARDRQAYFAKLG